MQRCISAMLAFVAALAAVCALAADRTHHAPRDDGAVVDESTPIVTPSVLHDTWWDRNELDATSWQPACVVDLDRTLPSPLAPHPSPLAPHPSPLTPRPSPQLRIDSFTATVATDGTRTLTVRWTAAGRQPSSRPITIRIATDQDGPWHTAAAGLRNSGEYRFPLDRRWTGPVHVRVKLHDPTAGIIVTTGTVASAQ